MRDDLLPEVMGGRARTERLHLRDAAARPVPVSCQLLRVDDRSTGRPLGVAAISRDLRHEQEDQRRATAVLERVIDPVLDLDAELRVTVLNDAAARLAARVRGGRPARHELVGAHVLTVLPALLGAPLEAAVTSARTQQHAVDAGRHHDELGGWWHVHVQPGDDDGVSVLLRDAGDWHAAEEASARQAEQQAVVVRLGARRRSGEDLDAFLADAVRRIGRAVGATFTLLAERCPAGDRLVIRAGAGVEHGDGTAVGRTDAGDLLGRALSGGAYVVDDVLAGGFDVAPGLRSHRPAAGAIVPVTGGDEVFGALAVFAHTTGRFTALDVTFLQAAAHALHATIERARAARQLERTREAERERIARALHDQALQDARYALGRAAEPPEGARRDDVLVDALSRIDEALAQVVYDLRPAGTEQPFAAVLEELVEQHRRMAPRLRIDLHLAPGPEPEPRTVEEVRHVLGEALTNVRRHAGARRVRVRSWTTAGQLWCDVRDDGRGARPEALAGRGIADMGERAAALGGHVTVRPQDAGGTAVRVRVPLSPPPATNAPIRVLLVEDHAAVRGAIAAALRSERDFAVVGEAATLAGARAVLAEVDVAVVELGLPDGDGCDLIPELREAAPGAHVLVLSARLDRPALARAVERGAAGALPKTKPLPEVLDAVRRVHRGETLLPLDEVVELLRLASRERERELLDRRAIESLTSREREVLQLIADGCDSRSAAARLHISVRTQRNHVASILAKLGVHSQLQALIFALRYGLVELRSPSAG